MNRVLSGKGIFLFFIFYFSFFSTFFFYFHFVSRPHSRTVVGSFNGHFWVHKNCCRAGALHEIKGLRGALRLCLNRTMRKVLRGARG